MREEDQRNTIDGFAVKLYRLMELLRGMSVGTCPNCGFQPLIALAGNRKAVWICARTSWARDAEQRRFSTVVFSPGLLACTSRHLQWMCARYGQPVERSTVHDLLPICVQGTTVSPISPAPLLVQRLSHRERMSIRWTSGARNMRLQERKKQRDVWKRARAVAAHVQRMAWPTLSRDW